MKMQLLSLALACAAAAFGPSRPAHAGSAFDRDWKAASAGPPTADADFARRLQAYFDAHRGYRDCSAHLAPGANARMLLRFDAAGSFRTLGEGAMPAAERCLAEFFASNRPPQPTTLPMDLPFRLE